MAKELQPPTPAWARDLTGGALLDTRDIKGLKRRGYIPTQPLRGSVYEVAGVPSDDAVPLGTTIVWNSLNDRLYRRTTRGWESVRELPDGADVTLAPLLYPSTTLYPSLTLYPGPL